MVPAHHSAHRVLHAWVLLRREVARLRVVRPRLLHLLLRQQLLLLLLLQGLCRNRVHFRASSQYLVDRLNVVDLVREPHHLLEGLRLLPIRLDILLLHHLLLRILLLLLGLLLLERRELGRLHLGLGLSLDLGLLLLELLVLVLLKLGFEHLRVNSSRLRCENWRHYRATGVGGRHRLAGLLQDDKPFLVEVEFLGGDVHVPVDHGDVEALKLVDVGEGDAADLGNELVRVKDVVKHFRRDQNCRQNQPKQKMRIRHWK